MNKKGFTLAELLGVIVILLALSLLVFPPLLNGLNKNKAKLSDATLKVYGEALNLYLDENNSEYDFSSGSDYCVLLSTLVEAKKLVMPLKDAVSGETISPTMYLKLHNNNGEITYELIEPVNVGLCNIINFQKYTVTFNTDGGAVVRPTKIVTNGNEYGSLPIPIKNDYNFVGWYTESNVKIEANSVVNLNSDVTLYARWEQEG